MKDHWTTPVCKMLALAVMLICFCTFIGYVLHAKVLMNWNVGDGQIMAFNTAVGLFLLGAAVFLLAERGN